MSRFQHDAMDEVLARIRREITRQGWTQTRLSHQSGVSSSAISKWMSGSVASPRFENVAAVMFALGLKIRVTVTCSRS